MSEITVSESKKGSLIQLCNVLSNNSITEITELADGEILYKTIQDKFPEYCKRFSTEVQSPPDAAKYVRNLKKDFESTENIFIDYIKSFIDDHYKIKSEDIIDYKRCGVDELQTIKMTIFVLSEIVNYFIHTQNPQMYTLCYTDTEYQVELQDIFDCFIVNRKNLKKSVVEELLSKSTKKSNPLTVTTPRRTRFKEKKCDSPSTPMECDEIYSNSPLKQFFDSPFQEKIILSKEKVNCEKLADEYDERESQLVSENDMLKETLKEKEKKYRDVLKKYEDIDEINRTLGSKFENLQSQYEKVLQDLTQRKKDSEILSMRIEELTKCIEEPQETEEQEEQNNKGTKKSLIDTIVNKDQEISLLKEKVNSLELKIHLYKKELSEKILTELKDKKPPGNINKSYEDVWCALNENHKEEEEQLSTMIVANNKELVHKLTLAECKIQNLIKEIEDLKKKTGKNQKSSQKKKTCSTSTQTVALNVQDILDTSKTPETERFRKSFNQSRSDEDCHLLSETSHILNNSDNNTPCEQSASFSKFETSPCSNKSPEAVLWRMYESQKSETESTYDINVNHDTLISENSNLNKGTGLNLNNIKIGNIEPNSLLNQENKCVLGNLNFDAFLTELKKLTKNGSFQKVLQVFKRWQERTVQTNKCDQVDLQEMLKVLTECLDVVVGLNEEYSFANLQDKCCSTDESELCSVDELKKLKSQLSTASEIHQVHLKECRKQIKNLEKEKIDLLRERMVSDQKIHKFEELYKKYKEKVSENKDLSNKLIEREASHEKSIEQHKVEKNHLKEMIKNEVKKKITCEKCCKLLKSEIIKLKQLVKDLREEVNCLKGENRKVKEENERVKDKNKKVKEENERLKHENFLKEKETRLFDSNKDIEYCLTPFQPKSRPEYRNAFQESVNDSTLSGAFQKSFSHYVSENEEDIFCPKPISKQFENERVQELIRRNSLYPKQLQSSYPLEADLNTTYYSLYLTADQQCKEQYHCKKRKLEDTILEEQLNSVTATPKEKRKFTLTPNVKRLIKKSLPSKQIYLKRSS